MSKLSPQAQAVVDATDKAFQATHDYAVTPDPARFIAAAALRAAADQPYEVPAYIRGDDYSNYVAGVEAERERNRAIADELDPGDGVEVGE